MASFRQLIAMQKMTEALNSYSLISVVRMHKSQCGVGTMPHIDVCTGLSEDGKESVVLAAGYVIVAIARYLEELKAVLHADPEQLLRVPLDITDVLQAQAAVAGGLGAVRAH